MSKNIIYNYAIENLSVIDVLAEWLNNNTYMCLALSFNQSHNMWLHCQCSSPCLPQLHGYACLGLQFLQVFLPVNDPISQPSYPLFIQSSHLSHSAPLPVFPLLHDEWGGPPPYFLCPCWLFTCGDNFFLLIFFFSSFTCYVGMMSSFS